MAQSGSWKRRRDRCQKIRLQVLHTVVLEAEVIGLVEGLCEEGVEGRRHIADMVDKIVAVDDDEDLWIDDAVEARSGRKQAFGNLREDVQEEFIGKAREIWAKRRQRSCRRARLGPRD